MMKISHPEATGMTSTSMRVAPWMAWICCLALTGSQQLFADSTPNLNPTDGLADQLLRPAPDQPQPSTQPILDLAVSENMLVGVGLRGLIVISEDEGNSWRQVPSPVATDLVAVQFSDAQHGWAVGHDSVLLQTEDGGESWTVNLDGRRLKELLKNYYSSAPSLDEFERENMLAEIALATTTSANPDVIPTPFLNVYINSDGKGFVLGAFGMLLHTDDNGQSWVPWIERTANERRMHLYGIDMRGNQVYISGEQGLLMRLDREQRRFVEVDLPYPGTLFGVSAQKGLILAYGLRGNVFASKDQGENWQQVDTGQKGSLVDVVRLNESHLLLFSQRGEVVRLNENSFKSESVDTALGGSVYSSVILRPSDTLVVAQFGGPKAFEINKLKQ